MLAKQNDVIISLLAKLAYEDDKIKDIICKNKKDPQKYILGYNSCNGSNNVTQLAKIIGVKPPTLTPILKSWEEECHRLLLNLVVTLLHCHIFFCSIPQFFLKEIAQPQSENHYIF